MERRLLAGLPLLGLILEVRMSDGWAILVLKKVAGGGESRQIYYSRFEDRVEAEEAVRKRVGAAADVVLEAQTLIEGRVFDETKVEQGEVSQW